MRMVRNAGRILEFRKDLMAAAVPTGGTEMTVHGRDVYGGFAETRPNRCSSNYQSDDRYNRMDDNLAVTFEKRASL